MYSIYTADTYPNPIFKNLTRRFGKNINDFLIIETKHRVYLIPSRVNPHMASTVLAYNSAIVYDPREKTITKNRFGMSAKQFYSDVRKTGHELKVLKQWDNK